MDDLIRSSMILQLICRLAHHLATIAPAASFWSSGVAVVRSRSSDGVALIAYLLVFFVSAGVVVIVYQPALKSANFGLVSIILAVLCAAKEMFISPSSVFPVERLKSCICEYGTLLWCLAVAVVLAPHLSSRRDVDELLSAAGVSQTSFNRQSFLDSIPERGGFEDDDGPLESLSTCDSVYFRYMVGPSSDVPSQSNSSDTGISLSPDAPCVDANRTARVQQTLSQTIFLDMTPAGPQDFSEDIDGLDPAMDG